MKKLRAIQKQDSDIRLLVQRHYSMFADLNKLGDGINWAKTDRQVRAVVARYLSDGNEAALTLAVYGVYQTSVVDVKRFERILISIANELKRAEHGMTATEILNIENILIKGIVYVKKD